MTARSGQLRATEDLDLLLPLEIVLNVASMKLIREALDELGFEPEVPYFQLIKRTADGPIKVDLLKCGIPDEHASDVKVKAMRVRPRGPSYLHAYMTNEAIEMDVSPTQIAVAGVRSDGTEGEIVVCIPNPFTYLLMKLHAFRDRVNDSRKKLASHHALDIYRIIAMMTAEEYRFVSSLTALHRGRDAVSSATSIVHEFFGNDSGVGVLRTIAGARDSGLDRARVETSEFVSVLHELFPSADV